MNSSFFAVNFQNTCFPHQIVHRGAPDKCVRGKQPDLSFGSISICDDTSSFRGRTGSLDSFIRWHAKSLLMTTVHSQPYIKHTYGNQRKLINQICREDVEAWFDTQPYCSLQEKLSVHPQLNSICGWFNLYCSKSCVCAMGWERQKG